jgi:hypothetical protein
MIEEKRKEKNMERVCGEDTRAGAGAVTGRGAGGKDVCVLDVGRDGTRRSPATL